MCDKSSSSIVIINLTSNSKFLHISNPYREKKGHHSEIKSQRPRKNGPKKQCFNGGERYNLLYETVGCILYMVVRSKTLWKVHTLGLGENLTLEKMKINWIQNRTCCKNFNSTSDKTKNFDFKIWRVLKFLIQNLFFHFFFSLYQKTWGRRMWGVYNQCLPHKRWCLFSC